MRLLPDGEKITVKQNSVTMMKTKLKLFAIMSVGMTVVLFICLMLLDQHDGEAREKLPANLILAVSVGILSSASLIFFKKSNRHPKQ